MWVVMSVYLKKMRTKPDNDTQTVSNFIDIWGFKFQSSPFFLILKVEKFATFKK